MARYTDAVCKLCRREGQKLFLKGSRCYTNKCAVERRAYAPGQHGQGRKKVSEYGLQLREKQKARRYYGILESQFHKYFLMAERRRGVTGESLLQICESRLDNVVYLLGWASSRAQARQLVNRGHFNVNGRRVNIPSYLLKAGDVIALRTGELETDGMKNIIEVNGGRPGPQWLSLDAQAGEAKVLNLPSRDQIDAPIQEQLIVELYSK
ncbi:MAG: 30S ribosomal protein S4 [Firmicutes bacterium ADurb.Bin300]|jgi:small subunit ribosomal protein S4|nr:MAG: 30S ribosomal protein S4 [Firmicutes bacterium ADurb.Bin300]